MLTIGRIAAVAVATYLFGLGVWQHVAGESSMRQFAVAAAVMAVLAMDATWRT
jgi:hypothetical protein